MFYIVEIIVIIIVIACGCCGQYSTGDFASGQNLLHLQSTIISPHVTKITLHRVKRGGGGGGFVPFRPLFIYRQQQKKKQEKWKEIEARKKFKQDQLLQYQQYQGAIQSPNKLQWYHPTIHYNSYYPTADFTSYPSYYYSQNDFDNYPTYYGNPYSDYYHTDG